MIQNLENHTFNNAFFIKKPKKNSVIFIFQKNKILIHKKDMYVDFVQYEEIKKEYDNYRFIFAIDDIDYFILNENQQGNTENTNQEFEFVDIDSLRYMKPKKNVFAAITAHQLYVWYDENKYCPKCGKKLLHSTKERMLYCTDCNVNIYPKISPGIIVGVINNNKILLTKYAGRTYKKYALIAGFTEIGESLEQTVKREVMEEVGLKVKDITYYKSQPWAYSSTLLCGFFARLDGDDKIVLEEDELAQAGWFSADEIKAEYEDFSLTNEMMIQFKEGKVHFS